MTASQFHFHVLGLYISVVYQWEFCRSCTVKCLCFVMHVIRPCVLILDSEPKGGFVPVHMNTQHGSTLAQHVVYVLGMLGLTY